MDENLLSALIDAAVEVRKQAYAPYSQFQVGASIVASNGNDRRTFTGCNVENASYGLAICAERSAACAAVAAGYQTFLAVVVAASPLASPCGACRQFLFEFGDSIEIIGVDPQQPDDLKRWTTAGLLPDGFRLE